MKTLMIVSIAAALAATLPLGCTRQESQVQAKPALTAGSVVTLDDASFDAQIQQGVVLVDFWATWCGPCKTQGPIVEQVAGQVADQALVAKLDVDAAPQVARRFHIESIPTLMVFKDGKPVKQFVGVTAAGSLVAAITAAVNAK